MSMELKIIDPSALSKEDRAKLDANIESLITSYKNNRQEINRLVFESVSAMTMGDEYERQLSIKKGLKRFIGEITGSNKVLQDKINSNRVIAQYAAQQTLQRLSEQNLMSFDLITAVNNKLNASVVAIEGEINEVYATLVAFFKQSRSDVIQLEHRVERLERNVNLLNWQNSIEYQIFNGVEYSDLSDTAKIVCLVRDFYDITKGDWTTSDLLLLKTAMNTIGLSPSQSTSYEAFFSDIFTDSSLLPKLFDDKDLLRLPFPTYLPIFYGIKKTEELLQDNNGLVAITTDMLRKHDRSIESADIIKELIHRDMWQTVQINTNSEVTYFNLSVEMLFCLHEATQNQLFSRDSKTTHLLHQAETGNPSAMLHLAIQILENGVNYIRTSWSDDLALTEDSIPMLNLSNYAYDMSFDNLKAFKQASYWLQKAADLGETAAMLALGDLLLVHFPTESYYWYRQGAIYGSTICMRHLADLLSNQDIRIDISLYDVLSDDNKKGIAEAIFWYERLAELPDIAGDAMLQLGALYDGNQAYYIQGSDEEKIEKALYWYRRSAEYGNIHAQYKLGNIYQNGYHIQENMSKAVEWYTKAAEQGNADAQYALGECYETGQGVCQDLQKAFEWYKRAAEQEDANARYKYKLAQLYSNGCGTQKDWTQSVEWYHKAANQGYSQAQLQLGLFYKDGDKLKQDLPQAVEWFEKAAQNGNGEAMCYLGDCYYHGWGVDKDLEKAFRWYERAADNGEAYAMRRVGDCYYDDEGAWYQDKLKAIQWFLKAAADREPQAMYIIGLIFMGLRDNEAAEKWLKRAAKQNISEAEKLLKEYFAN